MLLHRLARAGGRGSEWPSVPRPRLRPVHDILPTSSWLPTRVIPLS